MCFRLGLLMLFVAGLTVSLAFAGESHLPRCLMRPDYLEIRLPSRGFTSSHGGDPSGSCDRIPTKKWIRKAAGPFDLLVFADGPAGSGRYWNITVGVARPRHSKPYRGVCFRTSTVGWRTLQRYKNGPLPWLDDLNNDGRVELIVWNSFPLRGDASLVEYGLMGWVYCPISEHLLAIDWGLSRRMARDIARSYRARLDTTTAYAEPVRAEAAEALERFADEQCGVVQDDAHQ